MNYKALQRGATQSVVKVGMRQGCSTEFKDLFVEEVNIGTTGNGPVILHCTSVCVVGVHVYTWWSLKRMQTVQLVKTHLFTTTVVS